MFFAFRQVNIAPGLGGGVLPIMTYKGEAPPERGTFITLQVYERVGISRVEMCERVGKSVIQVFKRSCIKIFRLIGLRYATHYLFCDRWRVA